MRRRKSWVEEYDFLVIPQPQPDELLSSWLTRTAFAHGYKLTTFISLFLKHNGVALSRIDIDFKEDFDLFETLSKKSKLPIEDLFHMSIRSETGYLFESNNGLYPPKQIRKLHDKRTHYGLMFCPKCLAEDTHPYWRKKWRYIFYNACPKHKIFLTDQCGNCFERIRFIKMQLSSTLTYCSKCGRDLRLTITPKVPESHYYGIQAIQWFENGLKDGFFTINNQRIHSLFVFEVHTILSHIVSQQKDLQLENFLMLEEYKKLLLKENHYHSKKATPIYKDFYINAIVFYLLENFPHNLHKFAQDNQLTHRSFIHDFKKVPFWYQKIIDELIPLQNKVGREISESEVIGAIKYLENLGDKVTQENVAKVVGCHSTIHKQYVNIYKLLVNKILILFMNITSIHYHLPQNTL